MLHSTKRLHTINHIKSTVQLLPFYQITFNRSIHTLYQNKHTNHTIKSTQFNHTSLSYRAMSTSSQSFDVRSVLKDKSLFVEQCYINGQWQSANNNKTIDVFNPATDQLIGTVPNMSTPETKHAIQSAALAFTKWKQTTAVERSKILRKWYVTTKHMLSMF